MVTTESEWPDMGYIVDVLRRVVLQDKSLCTESIWSSAYEQLCRSLPPASSFTLVRRFSFEANVDACTMRIYNTGRFQLLNLLKMKGCTFSVSLLHLGQEKEIELTPSASGKWKPLQPVPFRHVEYIIIRKLSSTDSKAGQTLDIGMTRIVDPMLRAKVDTINLKCEYKQGSWLYLPAHPAPYSSV
jgi:hypothetical protein